MMNNIQFMNEWLIATTPVVIGGIVHSDQEKCPDTHLCKQVSHISFRSVVSYINPIINNGYMLFGPFKLFWVEK